MEWEDVFSENALKLKPSAIREILKAQEMVRSQGIDLIPMAGGMPDPQLHPMHIIRKINEGIDENAHNYQYCVTKGEKSLRENTSNNLREVGVNSSVDENMIVVGSQQALYIISKLLLDSSKDVILGGGPAYVGMIQAVEANFGKFVHCGVDKDNLVPSSVEEEIKKRKKEGKKVKGIYVVSRFDNPSGTCLTNERINELIEISRKYEIPIIEDAPYEQIYFERQPEPGIKARYPEGTIYLWTTSKIFAPVRIGGVVADSKFLDKAEILAQAMNLCPPLHTQILFDEYLKSGDMKNHLAILRKAYKEKADILLKALEEELPDYVEFTKAKGGLFTWLTVHKEIDLYKEFRNALCNPGVSYVFGNGFYTEESGKGGNQARLTFATPPKDKLAEGAKRMATVIKNAAE